MLVYGISDWLQQWAAEQVDGDWEHEMGITLAMLDNPGWDFNVDLVNYEKHLQDIPYVLVKDSSDDWLGYKIQNSYLNIVGDLGKLSCILAFFRSTVLLLDTFEGNRKITQTDLSQLFP